MQLADRATCGFNSSAHQLYYALPPDELTFYGYLNKALAMEKAKAGALATSVK